MELVISSLKAALKKSVDGSMGKKLRLCTSSKEI